MSGQATAMQEPNGVEVRRSPRADALYRREHALLIEAAALVSDAWERVHEADAVRSRRAPWAPGAPATGAETERAVDAFADAVAALAGRAAHLDAILRPVGGHRAPPPNRRRAG